MIRAFVRMREHVAANTAIIKRLAEIDKTLLEHDTALRDVQDLVNQSVLVKDPAGGRSTNYLLKE